MQIHISPKDGVPLYRQIMRQVRYLAASGRLEPGDKLPPVRKLAERLLVNPNTVARAYRELESEGLLTTRQGSGVFLSDTGSPLARSEQLRILGERIDVLLSEARQMKVSLGEVVDLMHQRDRQLSAQDDNTGDET